MHIRPDAPSGSATGTLLHLRSAPVVVQVSARCWEAGAVPVLALLLDWVVRRCIRISCAIDIVATSSDACPAFVRVESSELFVQGVADAPPPFMVLSSHRFLLLGVV
jgi:hypothetical protein